MSYWKPTTATAILLGLIGAASSPAHAVTPGSPAYQDGSNIVITGEVVRSSHDSFTLDYGTDTILVEMDDWDIYKKSAPLALGEKVTVYGVIDDGLYETRTLEAASVFAHNRNTYYYAAAVDEEGDRVNYYYPPVVSTGDAAQLEDGNWLSLSGRVVEVNSQEFTIRTGGGKTVRVDTDTMSYNPLDTEGLQQVRPGDLVYVSGKMEEGFFEADEIKANSVTTLSQARAAR